MDTRESYPTSSRTHSVAQIDNTQSASGTGSVARWRGGASCRVVDVQRQETGTYGPSVQSSVPRDSLQQRLTTPQWSAGPTMTEGTPNDVEVLSLPSARRNEELLLKQAEILMINFNKFIDHDQSLILNQQAAWQKFNNDHQNDNRDDLQNRNLQVRSRLLKLFFFNLLKHGLLLLEDEHRENDLLLYLARVQEKCIQGDNDSAQLARMDREINQEGQLDPYSMESSGDLPPVIPNAYRSLVPYILGTFVKFVVNGQLPVLLNEVNKQRCQNLACVYDDFCNSQRSTDGVWKGPDSKEVCSLINSGYLFFSTLGRQGIVSLPMLPINDPGDQEKQAQTRTIFAGMDRVLPLPLQWAEDTDTGETDLKRNFSNTQALLAFYVTMLLDDRTRQGDGRRTLNFALNDEVNRECLTNLRAQLTEAKLRTDSVTDNYITIGQWMSQLNFPSSPLSKAEHVRWLQALQTLVCKTNTFGSENLFATSLQPVFNIVLAIFNFYESQKSRESKQGVHLAIATSTLSATNTIFFSNWQGKPSKVMESFKNHLDVIWGGTTCQSILSCYTFDQALKKFDSFLHRGVDRGVVDIEGNRSIFMILIVWKRFQSSRPADFAKQSFKAFLAYMQEQFSQNAVLKPLIPRISVKLLEGMLKECLQED